MNESTDPRPAPRSPLTFDDLIGDLVWPILLRAAGLALSPQRLGIAFFLIIVMSLVLWAGEAATRGKDHPGVVTDWRMQMIQPADAADLDAARFSPMGGASVGTGWGLPAPQAAARWLYHRFIGRPASVLVRHPIATIILIPVLIWLLTIGGGAICRSAACDFALGVSSPWPRSLGFALSKWTALFGSVFGPLAIIWLIGLGMAVGGWVLFNVPVLNAIGGLIFGLCLLLGFIAAIVMAAFVLAHPVLVPAVACEGTDAFDAVSRAYELVFNRPLRLVLYWILLLVEGVISVFVVAVIVALLVYMTRAASGAWVGDAGRALLLGEATSAQGWTWQTGAWLVRIWTTIPYVLVGAFIMSFYFSASTLLYLAMRRITDGQDVHEIWVPGMVESTMAEALSDKGRKPVQPETDGGE